MYFIHSVPVTPTQPPCPFCKLDANGIAQTGRVGCAECYRHFSERLSHHIRRIHGSAAHRGDIPQSAGEELRQKRRIAELKSALRQAIERQEFERCAELRDEINSIECNCGREMP